ncbi:xanthine dehydrogenase-like [Trichoplusia ni]|uniref:Xanthine dehydrogenase-like n=1 Tax=Trichoplusia ni TaxID=7111 RepID=A0A7E5WN93_TRINI|nr:xanthine dehydrogenase-like [Trichoplusia ni]
MAMHGVMESKGNFTMKELENSFGSNICRCTGYRPILEAFKKFAVDAPKEDRITDVSKLAICNSKGKCCKDEEGWCMVNEDDAHMNKVKSIRLKDGKNWFKARVLQDIFDIFAKEGTDSYMLVGGNTAKGVSPISEYPRVMIDISAVHELRAVQYDQNIIIGAATTLTEFQNILEAKSTENAFSYFNQLIYHVKLVAHIPVQNIGTIAGNLMIKHADNMFQSDIFLLLETVGAMLNIVDQQQTKYTVSLVDFLKMDMKGKVIVNVMFPPLSDRHKIYTYKLMSRAQSVHAIVNAGFLYELDPTTNVVQSARIVYGALSPNFTRAKATEAYLIGKPLFTNETLQGAMGVLNGEMIIVENPPEPSVEYRRYLACALFYKGLLTLSPPEMLQRRLNSGAVSLHDVRPVSTGQQVIQTDPNLWPYNQPIMKDEAMIQCAGEAKFTEDIPAMPGQVYGAFVLSTIALGTIVKIDASAALSTPGVLAFYTAKDIPGLNSYTPNDISLYSANEEILCDGNVRYYNQPIGIVVAETHQIASRATQLVQVKYNSGAKPVIDIKEAVKDSSRSSLVTSFEATNPGTDVYKTISGSNTLYGQYHFPMETLACIAKPTEEGLEVHSTTQYLDGVQTMIARALNMDASRIDVHVRRLGGGYGLKLSRGSQAAVACSLIVQKLQRPCRFVLPLSTIMQSVGKRTPCISIFEVAVNREGLIQSLDSNLYEDSGYVINEMMSTLGLDVYNNCYDKSKINYKVYDTVTDMASNTFCRSPGTLEAISAFEHIMEQISYELSVDPAEVRLANTDPDHLTEMKNVFETLKTNADYVSRRAAVNSYNTENRWKKRGLRWAFVKWVPTGAQQFNVIMSVYRVDGTITITHAGVEMGQGINTKAKQIAAHLLNVPLDKIQIKGNNTHVAPNSYLSGGSLTTTSVMIGLKKCCEQLNARLEPIRATLENPTWEELIAAASTADVDLQTHGYAGFNDAQSYHVYGMALCEVELDVLTNEFEILRVDLLQDVGLSVSPEIDIGQVEGGFVMGLGYWTCEKLVYTEQGQILTDRTWNYHLPLAKDIPQDFRVYLKKNSYSNDFIMGAKGRKETDYKICLYCTFFSVLQILSSSFLLF